MFIVSALGISDTTAKASWNVAKFEGAIAVVFFPLLFSLIFIQIRWGWWVCGGVHIGRPEDLEMGCKLSRTQGMRKGTWN